MNQLLERVFISTNPANLQPTWIITTMAREAFGDIGDAVRIRQSWEGSLCFGAYITPSTVDDAPETTDRAQQVGFARFVTDGARSSSLCELVVDSDFRGHGIGRRLMEVALNHPKIVGTSCILGTRSAASFYEKFNFGPVPMYVMCRPPGRAAIER